MSQRASRANVSTGQSIKKDIIISSCLRLGKAEVLSVFFFSTKEGEIMLLFSMKDL